MDSLPVTSGAGCSKKSKNLRKPANVGDRSFPRPYGGLPRGVVSFSLRLYYSWHLWPQLPTITTDSVIYYVCPAIIQYLRCHFVGLIGQLLHSWTFVLLNKGRKGEAECVRSSMHDTTHITNCSDLSFSGADRPRTLHRVRTKSASTASKYGVSWCASAARPVRRSDESEGCQ